ncbi:MAG TPA: BON domain-containing protein [Rubrivivax sp.]|nr:BON domain-containing protein [Rubrivivax sp.]
MTNLTLRRTVAARHALGRALLAALAISGVLGGCVAVVGGAVAGGTMLAVDRRSTGAQVDDQTIELRAATVIADAIGERGNVSVTSYNRVVLLTGQVPNDADRAKVEAAVAKVENVHAVVNELAVMPNSSLAQISTDTLTTTKVKSGFVQAKELQMASIKVVTERGVVYLMGRVTEAEANVAAHVARSVGGVQKVVKVFETITPAELAAMPVPPTNAASAAPAASAAKP